MTEVVVLGGGILGLTTAYRLSQAGARVTVLEAEALASGTSRASFAWINANMKPPLPYHRLNVSGMAEYHRLRQEFDAQPWLHLHGNIEWDHTPGGQEKLRDKVTRLREWNYPVELLPIDEISRLEPDLLPPPGVTEALYYPTEGYADVPLLVGTLAQAAQATGARILTGRRATRIVQEGGRVGGVETADGERHAADVVVSCLGRWTTDLAMLAGLDVPMAPTVGLTVVTAPSPVRLRAIHHHPGLNVRPDGAGRLMLQSSIHDRQMDAATPVEPLPAAAHDLFARAVAILPALAGVRLETARIGVRSIPADGYSAVGPVPHVTGLYLVVTHSAVTMGPLLGRLASAEIVRGERDSRLASFRPERLVVGRSRSV